MQQRTAMTSQLAGLVAVLRRDPPIAPPIGADAAVSTESGINAIPGGPRTITGDVRLSVWPYMVDGGHFVYNNGLAVFFLVNYSMCAPDDAAGAGLGFAFAPTPNGRFHGYPMLDSTVVITHRGASPCLSVTREELLTALSRKTAHASSTDDSDTQAAMREQEAGLRELAKTNPTAAAQVRAQLAQTQRTTDSIVKSLNNGFANALARMSPAERSSPAYVSESECTDSASGCLVDANTPGARMIVRSNPAFFDATRPADVQLITVDIRHVLDDPNPSNPFVVKLMSSILDQLDWVAVGALVK